jgi:glycosyltransferase involved in cell wall biosynthesis
VIYNIVTSSLDAKPHPQVPADHRFRIACLSNYSWSRGLDRLAEVAKHLMMKGRHDVLFVMAGDMGLSRSLPGELGSVARAGGTLGDYVARRGVGDMFLFLGHVTEPEGVLAACHALVKPTRENNPWGRDILEALAAGRPVLTCGAYDRFVESGVTGVLQPEFDAGALAAEIARLADDRGLAARMGRAGRERVLALCDGKARAAELLDLWEGARREAAR